MGIFGGLVGLKTAQILQNYNAFIKDNISVFSGIGIFIGLLFAPLFANLFHYLIELVSKKMHAVSFQEVFLGISGLIAGLVISILSIFALSYIPFNNIPIFGDYIAPFIYVLITLFFVYLGIYWTTRPETVSNVLAFFERNKNSAEFKNYKIIDTSAIIDSRIYDVYKTGIIEGTMIVPQFILDEIHILSDSADDIKRSRGRRALELLNKLKEDFKLEVYQDEIKPAATDSMLIFLSQKINGTIITTDFNLASVARVQGVKSININEVASSFKQIIHPGEDIEVSIVKEGKEANQGVAYLDDGTMIVVEDGRKSVGQKKKVHVNSVLQTVGGKIFFARIDPDKGKK
jgi:uncharacterized protein YacL